MDCARVAWPIGRWKILVYWLRFDNHSFRGSANVPAAIPERFLNGLLFAHS
jgi:hypothetical protein